MNLIGAASSAGAATMIVRSIAPASASVWAMPTTVDMRWPDRDVDRDQVGVLVVDDRVDRDRRLAGLAVADDQLALAAADRDHRVDRLEAGLHRLLHRLALDHAGGLELGRARLGRLDLALAVERVAERVDDAAQQRLADRDVEQALGALDRVALDDVLPRAEQHRADVVGLEAEGEAGHVVRQLEHLERHAVLQAVDARDAVGDRQHGADLGQVRLVGVEPLDAALEDGGDLVWLDLHGAGSWLLGEGSRRRGRSAGAAARGGGGWRRRAPGCRRARRCRRGCRARLSPTAPPCGRSARRSGHRCA